VLPISDVLLLFCKQNPTEPDEMPAELANWTLKISPIASELLKPRHA